MFKAQPSAVLATTQLPIDPSLFAGLKAIAPKHDSTYWADVTKGMDFSAEDRIDFDQYNHILWNGLMGGKPYPTAPTGTDLRDNRGALLLQSARQHEQGKAAGGF
jgi:hypothetical protein